MAEAGGKSTDQIYGSGPTRAAVLAQLRWSAGLLDGSCPERLRTALHSAVGYLSHTCGMIAFDACEHDDARRAFRLALACADEAGDWHLRAKVYSSTARRAIWLGEPDEDLTSAAVATAGTVRSRRLADDLRNLSGYAEPHSATDEVAALRHQIATTLVGS